MSRISFFLPLNDTLMPTPVNSSTETAGVFGESGDATRSLSNLSLSKSSLSPFFQKQREHAPHNSSDSLPSMLLFSNAHNFC